MKFEIIRSTNIGIKNELFLKSDEGHCHVKTSVMFLLKSNIFKKTYPELIMTFEKVLNMMKSNETGIVDI
jgi:hypothetical protein